MTKSLKNMATDNLKQKAASGMIWTAVQKYSTMIVSFISGIVLARLLTPADFGCIGMLAIFMSLADTFIDGGFGSALIQKKNPTQDDYSTVFIFNMGMSLIIYLLLYFSAPAISIFYDIEELCVILRVQGIILFISALAVIQRNQIRKNLQFKKLAVIQIFTSVIALVVTIFFAYKGFGVWALVFQNIIAVAIPCVYFWITTSWHPTAKFSTKSFRELFGFGSYMLLCHIFNTLSDKISGLLIGRWFNPATMGYYTKAVQTENMASSSISGVMQQTTYPLYAAIQDDNERLINMIKRITSTLAYITIPLLILLIVIAKPVFILLYSEKWIDSVPYFQILCLAGIAGCLQGVNHQVIAAIGKSKVMFKWVVIKKGFSIGLQIAGLVIWGMKGLMIGLVISAWFSYYVNIALVSKHVGYRIKTQIYDLIPVIIVSSIAAVVALAFAYLVPISNIYILGLIQTFLFASVYLFWSIVFKPESFVYAFSILKSLKK